MYAMRAETSRYSNCTGIAKSLSILWGARIVYSKDIETLFAGPNPLANSH